MADSGGKQKISLPLPPPEPVTSRPLRTGQEFVLILNRHRMIYRHWDKEEYRPGDEAELILEGEHLGKKPLELIVESSYDATDWRPVTTIEVEPDEDRASAKFTIPRPGEVGKVTKAEWKREKAKAGERLGFHVETENYEGFCSIHVERMNDEGTWDVVTRWQNDIKDNKLDDVYALPPAPLKDEPRPIERLIEASFDREDHQAGDVAWLVCTAENAEQEKLQFVLERDAGDGWEEVGSGVATVQGGVARCPMVLQSGKARLLEAHWKPGSGLDVDLIATAQEMEHEQVTFVLEKQVGNDWVTVGETEAIIEGGVARIETRFPTPSARDSMPWQPGVDDDERDPRTDGSDTGTPDDAFDNRGVDSPGGGVPKVSEARHHGR